MRPSANRWFALNYTSHSMTTSRPAARMSPNIPAHQALRLQVEASVSRRPDRVWVRSSGRPRNRWIDRLREDHQRPPADLWRATIRRGHTGATLRSSTTTR